jgi:hypothetical protein
VRQILNATRGRFTYHGTNRSAGRALRKELRIEIKSGYWRTHALSDNIPAYLTKTVMMTYCQ